MYKFKTSPLEAAVCRAESKHRALPSHWSTFTIKGISLRSTTTSVTESVCLLPHSSYVFTLLSSTDWANPVTTGLACTTQKLECFTLYAFSGLFLEGRGRTEVVVRKFITNPSATSDESWTYSSSYSTNGRPHIFTSSHIKSKETTQVRYLVCNRYIRPDELQDCNQTTNPNFIRVVLLCTL